ncbi:MAG: Monosaccharide-transporting ATPase [Marmoricola sp.]|jgi:ribose transport system ATP-binding protein|nr:Monosaccharide-transporting ATPase [Marmoricola sp.]
MTPSDTRGQAVTPALAARNLSKTFNAVTVLSSVDLTIAPGEIHALLGENGSGKSTFIKILAGYHKPDAGGELLIDGQEVSLGSADSAYSAGCRFVHQDLGLVETSSVLDNLFLNRGFPSRWGTISGREARRLAREQLARVGLTVDPRTPVAALSPALKTGVAVARALLVDESVTAKLLVLDEPTATLPDNEVRHLLEIVRRVAGQGIGVLYVTHRLDEVFQLAHNVTVLRDGRKAATEPVTALDRKRLINLLVGREFEEIHAVAETLHEEKGAAVLEVEGLHAGVVRGISFTCHPGVVVGIAGITGSGRETLLGSLFGAHRREAGTVQVDGTAVAALKPARAMKAGVAYLPPDRKALGGFMDFTARENLTLCDLSPFWGRLHLHRRREVAEARDWFERLEVRPAGGHNQLLATFSGGNQQKVLFGKWLRRHPKVLLLDEPTQGVDVGAKAGLHRLLLGAAEGGAVVVVSSSDVDELAALCHRVIVLRDGQVAADLSGGAVSVANIARECLGADNKVGAA